MKRSLILVLAIAAVGAPAASAYEIGTTNLTPASTTNDCGGGQDCTYFNGTLAAPANRAPADGIITRWSLTSGAASGPVTLRVLRQAFTVGILEGVTPVNSSATETTVSGTGTWPTRQPIKGGDFIGVRNTNSTLMFAPNAGTSITKSVGALADNQFGAVSAVTGRELLVRAVVEPDVDGDNFGDVSQDACPGDAASQTAPCRADFAISGPATLTPTRLRRVKVATATVAYRVTTNRPATVTLRVDAIRPGRSVTGICVPLDLAPTGKACTWNVQVRKVVRAVGAGTASVPFRMRGLPVGAYLVTASIVGQGSGRTITTVHKFRIAK